MLVCFHDVAAALSGPAGFLRKEAESRQQQKKEDPKSFSVLLHFWIFIDFFTVLWRFLLFVRRLETR